MNKFKFFALAAFLLFAVNADASSSYLQPYFKKQAIKVGSGKYYYRGLIHAYDAALYSPDGKFNENGLFALTLTYRTGITGSDIAEKGIEEINGQEKLDDKKSAEWLAKMTAIFPDVDDGISLTGLNLPGKGMAVFKNDKKIGEIDDKEFARRFFDIWLGPKTSEPDLRAELLGKIGE